MSDKVIPNPNAIKSGDMLSPSRRVAVEAIPRAEIARLRAEVKRFQVQLAGCLTAAEGGYTSEKQLAKPQDYGWSLAYEAVIKVRRERDEALAQVAVILGCLTLQKIESAIDEAWGEGEEGESGVLNLAKSVFELIPDDLLTEARALLDRFQRAKAVVEAVRSNHSPGGSECREQCEICQALGGGEDT